MRGDPAVGAHRDPHTGRDRPAERGAVDVDDHPGLVDDRRWQADAGIDRIEHALWRDEGRHEPRPPLEHQLDRLVIEVDPVVDRADSGPDGVLDPVGALGVGHDEHPCCGGLLDERLELGRAEMGLARVVTRREHAARGRDLDDVGARPAQLANLAPDLVNAVDDA